MNISEGMNPRQMEAVEYTEGPLLILAGAGSGKTRVLTHRIAYLIEEKQVPPYQIMAITFTNKAAQEMRERVDRIVSFGAEQVWVSTFHSSCVRILRRYADRIGYGNNFTIYDTEDSKTLMKAIIKKLNLDTKTFKDRSLLSAISAAKNEVISPEQYRKDAGIDWKLRKIADVYDEYQEQLRSNNAMDFDDLLVLKGSAGCGKSTMMRRIGEAMEERGEEVEYLHCSGDPASLDGVRFPRLRTAVVDGTAPHVVEPRYPAAVERYVDLGVCYDVAAAKASVQTAQINLGYASVTSPISGRIGRALVTEGALVGQGDTTQLATVQQIDPLYVNFTQSASEALRLQRAMQSGKLAKAGAQGAVVKLVLDDGTEYPLSGKLLFTDLTVDSTSGQVSLRAELPNPKGALLPGLYVRVRLEQAQVQGGILIPQQAVTRGAQGDTVMVVDPQGQVSTRPVKLGGALGNQWVVTEGLKAGEQVMVDGFQKVRPKAPVKAVPWTPPPAGAASQASAPASAPAAK